MNCSFWVGMAMTSLGFTGTLGAAVAVAVAVAVGAAVVAVGPVVTVWPGALVAVAVGAAVVAVAAGLTVAVGVLVASEPQATRRRLNAANAQRAR